MTPNLLILCLDCLRRDHVTSEIMPALSSLGRAGLTHTGWQTPVPWTPCSVASMLIGRPDAFRAGPEGCLGEASLVGRLRRTHRCGAFLCQATLATEDALWVFRDFDDLWTCSDGSWWGPVEMTQVLKQFLPWRDQQEGPWAAYVHLFEVHEPFWPEWLGACEEPAPRPDLTDGIFTTLLNKETGALGVSAKEADYLRRRYRAYCTNTDARLSDLLEDMLDGQTVVIVTSDHGVILGEDGLWGWGVRPWCHHPAALDTILLAAGPGIEPETLEVGACNSYLPDVAVELLKRSATSNAVDLSAVERRLRDLGYI